MIFLGGNGSKRGVIPGVICMILMPWFIYKIYPPEIKETPQAAAMAQKELDALGPITKAEISVAIIFCALYLALGYCDLDEASSNRSGYDGRSCMCSNRLSYVG